MADVGLEAAPETANSASAAATLGDFNFSVWFHLRMRIPPSMCNGSHSKVISKLAHNVDIHFKNLSVDLEAFKSKVKRPLPRTCCLRLTWVQVMSVDALRSALLVSAAAAVHQTTELREAPHKQTGVATASTHITRSQQLALPDEM